MILSNSGWTRMRGADYRTEYCGCGTFLRMRKSVNIILVFALCAGTMMVRNVCWEASRLEMSCFGLL